MSEMVLNIISGIAYLILAPVIGGLLAGLDRKISARMQRRVGPPVLQPFYDFFKLWDVCFIVAAYSSNSPYSQVGAERELVQTMAYEPMLLLMALGFYLKCGSFSIDTILKAPSMNFIYMPGIFVGLSFILLIKFRKSPFDLSMSHEVHQELIRGVITEFSGRTLAMIELAHWYENVFLLGFVYLFFAWSAPWSPALAVLMCLFTYFSDVLVDNCCSRVKWEQMLSSTWLVTLVAGFVNIMFLMYMR